MKFRAWLESYFTRGRKKSKKCGTNKDSPNLDSRNGNVTGVSICQRNETIERVQHESNAAATDLLTSTESNHPEIVSKYQKDDNEEDYRAANINETIVVEVNELDDNGNDEDVVTSDVVVVVVNQRSNVHSSICDVRRTPLLGIRSAFSRNNAISESNLRSDSLSSVVLIGNSTNDNGSGTPRIRCGIRTNPWWSTNVNDSPRTSCEFPPSNCSTLSSSGRSGNLSSNEEPFHAMEESSSGLGESGCSNHSSVVSTLESERRGQNRNCTSGATTFDDRYIDFHRQAVKKLGSESFEDVNDTDDDGRTITDVNKIPSSLEADEAFSEASLLTSDDSPNEETLPTLKFKTDVKYDRVNTHHDGTTSDKFGFEERLCTISDDLGVNGRRCNDESSKKWRNNRSIRQICEGLEQKVQRIRQERYVVEGKIKEAKEEERIRCEEKIKFQREMILHRRQILLRTIQNVRYKLEEQESRIQDAYSSTLEMQLNSRLQKRNF